jgi:hypothetical protein
VIQYTIVKPVIWTVAETYNSLYNVPGRHRVPHEQMEQCGQHMDNGMLGYVFLDSAVLGL